MIKRITTDDLRRMNNSEGLIIQGCGGDSDEWIDGINNILTQAGILLDGDTFRDVSVFEHDGLTNLLFNMDNVNLDIGRLAMWRLQNHGTFGGTWLSDYVPNRLGGFVDSPSVDDTDEDFDESDDFYEDEDVEPEDYGGWGDIDGGMTMQ